MMAEPQGPRVDPEALLHELDAQGRYERTAGGYWARWPDLDIRAMAALMRAREVRLVTITARAEPDGGYRVIYHWDVGPTVLNISTTVVDGTLPTISDILPGADWAEREMRDYYGVDFSGRAQTPTLMLREGDPPGLFSRTSTVGTDTDPARAARAAATGGSESR